MKIRLDLIRSFYISAFLIFAGFLSLQAYADGIASVNQFVEIKPNATDFRARKQSTKQKKVQNEEKKSKILYLFVKNFPKNLGLRKN